MVDETMDQESLLTEVDEYKQERELNKAIRESFKVPYNPDTAFADNKAYWDTKEFAAAGRISEEFEFLPGRTAELKTLDIQEQTILGRMLDQTVGKFSPAAGVASSYDDVLYWYTVAMSMIKLDGESIYTPITADEDPDNIKLSTVQREVALTKRCNKNLQRLQSWSPWIVKKLFTYYNVLQHRQNEALLLLPKFSASGEQLSTFAKG
jgi:hypothetical protein